MHELQDSAFADGFSPSRGFRRGAYSPRTEPASAVVVHTTGYGPIRRWRSSERERFGYQTPFDAALRIYQQIMDAGPHYLVGQRGEITQLCPEHVCAWHVGRSGGAIYRWIDRRHAADYSAGVWRRLGLDWWPATWRQYRSPLDLAGGRLWAGGSVNANTIGIEVVPRDADPWGAWSTAALRSLSLLLLDVCTRNRIPIRRDHILTHSDAHPVARTRKGKPWDPAPPQFDWGTISRLLRKAA